MVHVSRIDLNLFTVFDAIYSEGGVTRAAEKLNLTQPAISHALARLRQMFDDPLFLRQGHQMIATPLARNIIDPVRQALRIFEIAINETSHFDPGQTAKRIVVGLHDSMEATVLPPLLRGIIERAPLIDVVAARIDRRQLESGLASGSIDVAIDVLLPLTENVRHQRIARDRMIVVARRDHPRVGVGLDLATYLAEQHILVTSRRRGTGPVDIELSRLGLQRRIRLRSQHYFAACRIVSATDLILTMPEYDARMVNQPFENQILALPIEAPPLDIYLYWHASVDSDPANRWLRAQVGQVFQGNEGDG